MRRTKRWLYGEGGNDLSDHLLTLWLKEFGFRLDQIHPWWMLNFCLDHQQSAAADYLQNNNNPLRRIQVVSNWSACKRSILQTAAVTDLLCLLNWNHDDTGHARNQHCHGQSSNMLGTYASVSSSRTPHSQPDPAPWLPGSPFPSGWTATVSSRLPTWRLEACCSLQRSAGP